MAVETLGRPHLPKRQNTRGRAMGTPFYMPFLFLAPAFILLIAFRYVPAFSAVYHSFTDWNGQKANYVGLLQYETLLKDPVFLKSVINIGFFSITRVAFVIFMALIGAELVYNLRSTRMQQLWRVVFTLPIVVSSTVVLLVWRQVFAARDGILNQFLTLIGLGEYAQAWLSQPNTALQAIIFVGFPFISGLNFLILLSALQNLSSEVNDAAMLDGCTKLSRVWQIHIPALRGSLSLLTILGLSAGIQEFSLMLLMTNGGPANATMSPGFYLYLQAFTYSKFGYATAIGTVLMLVTVSLSAFVLWARYRRAFDVDI
jgi:raffinose/stachyose/melibiose transport system permease protein